MFPKIRSKSQKNLDSYLVISPSKKKSKEWSDRFVLQNMPEYSPLKDPHIKKYRKSKINMQRSNSLQQQSPFPQHKSLASRKLSQPSNKQVIIDEKKLTENLKKKLHSHHINIMSERIPKIIGALQHSFPEYVQEINQFYKVVSSHAVPQYFMYYLLRSYLIKALQNKNVAFDIKGQMSTQIKQIKNRESYFYKINGCYQARQRCLEAFSNFIKDKVQNQQEVFQNRQKIQSLVKNLRLITANLVQLIAKWRQILSIESSLNIQNNQQWMMLPERPIFYLEKQKKKENMLIHILNDNKFILKSVISNCVQMGTKNDPFLLSPLKKAEGKQRSEILQIFYLQQEQKANFNKLMQFLANQKAHEIKNKEKRIISRELSDVEKVYMQKHRSRMQNVLSGNSSQVELDFGGKGGEEVDSMKQHIKKIKMSRIKKNQERMSMIRAVYERGDRSIANIENKNEDESEQMEQQTNKNNKQKQLLNRKQIDEQFDKLVNQSYKLLQLSSPSSKEITSKPIVIVRHKKQSKVAKGEQTEQDRMINKLNSLNMQLRSKLNEIQKQTEQRDIGSPKKSNFAGKSNKEIVDELKKQIITKIEAEQAEKQKAKKRRKEQEQKILEQIKERMKSDLQQKLNSRKLQKLQQKQRLQKLLQQEQLRIKQQRQLQIQMLMKINKQKQMKNLQKLKRQAIEKQNQLKQQLAKEQLLRKQRQQQIEKQKREKQKLIRELEVKELKYQIEREVKEEYSKKNDSHRNVIPQSQLQILKQIAIGQNEKEKHDSLDALEQNSPGQNGKSPNNSEMKGGDENGKKSEEQLKLQRELLLKKQMALVQEKQQKQIHLIEKQNQIRKKMLLFKKSEQQIVDKDIDYLIKRNIHFQKSEEGPQYNSQNKEEEMRRLEVKKKMEEEEQQQKLKQAEITKIRKQRQIEQNVLREKIRSKIEKQLRMEAVKRTRQEIDERQVKQMQRKKMQHEIRTKIFNENPIIQENFLDQQKLKLLQSEFLQKQVTGQSAKTSLRSQFQKELLASSLPPKFFVEKQLFKVKNTQHYLGQDYLYDKLENSKEGIQKLQQIEHSPLKKQRSRVKQHVYELTNEQLYIYKKQKNKYSENMNREEENKVVQNKIKNSAEYELVRPKDEQVEADRIYVKQYRSGKYRKKGDASDSQDEIKSAKKQQSRQPSKKKKKENYKNEESDGPNSQEGNHKEKLKKLEGVQIVKQKEKPRKVKKKEQSDEKEVEEKVVNGDGSGKERGQTGIKLKGQTGRKSKGQQNEDRTFQVPEVVRIKKEHKEKQSSSKFSLQFEAISEQELDYQLQAHFSRIPPSQAAILTLTRHQLYRQLITQLTFSIAMGTSQNRLAGVAYIHHDRLSSPQTRKFCLSHISTYSDSDLKQFILAVCQFVFLKDPCQQIQFLYVVNQKNEQDALFIEQLVRWFAVHGDIYQKKLQEGIFQRKFLYRRGYQHKCEVSITGVNKNSFNNTLSIVSSILVSKLPLSQHREYFSVMNDEFLSKIAHNLLLAEIFRMYLSPQQAEKLKKNLKQNTLFKELLGIILTLQKKKVRIEEYTLSQFKSVVELNMKMLSQGKDPVNYVKDASGESGNQIFIGQIIWKGAMMCTFQVAALPISEQQDNKRYSPKQTKVRHISYFRLRPIAPQRLHLLKSSLYNTQMYLLPCQNPKLKILLFSAQQFLAIKQKQLNEPAGTPLTLHNYLRYFMKNISKYNRQSQYDYIWVPEVSVDKKVAKLDIYKDFYDRHMYLKDGLSMNYRQFIPSGLIIQPQHRDLVITAPFVLGIISMTVEQVLEGCAVYARLLQLDDLRLMEME